MTHHIEQYKYRNGLLPMQYVFFDTLERWLYEIRHEAQPSDVFLTTGARAYQKHVLHGQETVSICLANLHEIFNDILRKNHRTLLYCGRIVRHYDSSPSYIMTTSSLRSPNFRSNKIVSLFPDSVH